MNSFRAFTLRFENKSLNLHTPCGVSHPYDPSIETNPGHPEQFKGLWDTGATGTVITLAVAEKLGIKPIGKRKCFHAQGHDIVNVYLINLFLPNGIAFHRVEVIEGKLNGCDLLIGMDIISLGDFSITNVKGKTVFSFRLPSIKEVDFVEESKIPVIATSEKIGRNISCPCGSGKKYKHCHGKGKI